MLSLTPTLALCILSVWLLKRIQLGYFSPLAKIPNSHFTAPFSNIWTIINKWIDCENRARYEAHKLLGPVVRIGPKELSVNCIEDGVRTIYGAEFDKDQWYPRIFGGDGTPCMFTMLPKKDHAERRRMLSSVYQKSFIQGSSALQHISETIIDERFKSQVLAWAQAGAVVDVLEKNKACLMDLTTAWLYGFDNGTDFLNDTIAATAFFSTFEKSIAGSSWRSEFHLLSKTLAVVGIHLVPRTAKESRRILELWGSMKCDAAQETNSSQSGIKGSVDVTTHPIVYSQLRQCLEQTDVRSEGMNAILSVELLDHVVASHDVTGVTLSWVMYELSRSPYWQSALREELVASNINHLASLAHRLDTLPILDAVITETMRLRSANPGPWPRCVPLRGCRIGEFVNIPAGTVVSASSYTLHRNADVFPEPEQWRPERWLSASVEHRKAMMRWFWAFGSGARVCIGNHFALHSMKMVLAATYVESTTSVADQSGLEQRDAIVAGPLSGKVMLNFSHTERS